VDAHLGCGDRVVVRELGKVRMPTVLPEALERPRHYGMEPPATNTAEARIDRVADQRVGEPVTAVGPRNLLDQASGARLLECVQHAIGVAGDDALEEGDGERRSRDRPERKQPDDIVADACEPTLNDLTDARRDTTARDLDELASGCA
jgi:hypothetical protein